MLNLGFGNFQAIVPPSVIGTVSTFVDSTNTTGTRTLSHTTVSGTTCLVVLVNFRSGNSVGTMSCTFNGVSMTMGPDVNTATASPNGRSTIYYLLNPSIGTFNVVSTTTSNQIVSIVAVNTTATTAGAQNSATVSGSATISAAVTPTQDALVFAGSEICVLQAPTSRTGTTLYSTTGSNSFGTGSSYVVANGGASQTMSHVYGTDTTKKTIAVMAFY